MTRPILVTGGTGQLGTELARAPLGGGMEWVMPGRATLDLADAAGLYAHIVAGGYAAVVNAGAYTAVDAAESDPVAAWQANALAPAAIASACATADIPVIQLSTDYVFGGTQPGPIGVDTPIAPINVYGASKAGGEFAVRTSGARHAIVRTAWVVSSTGRNFVKTMLALAAQRDELRVVNDQHGSPTSAATLAAAIVAIVKDFIAEPARPSGTWHVANRGFATWFDIADHVFSVSHGKRPHVVPVSSAEFPTPARRPTDSRLDVAAAERDFSLALPDWRPAIAAIVEELENRKAIHP